MKMFKEYSMDWFLDQLKTVAVLWNGVPIGLPNRYHMKRNIARRKGK